MRMLAFETSAKAVSVALLDDDRLLGETYLNCGLTHSVTLLKAAQELLSLCACKPEELTAIACASGPGSFTGVRIGVAAAKGFAWGAQLPCLGVSSLAAMAQQGRLFEGVLCCAMDARREQVYNALFFCRKGELTRLCEDRAVSLSELAEELSAHTAEKIILGDGAQLCYNTFGKTVHGCRCAPESQQMQRASGVALLARQQLLAGAEASGAALRPNYLRLSQAERERLQKGGQNG